MVRIRIEVINSFCAVLIFHSAIKIRDVVCSLSSCLIPIVSKKLQDLLETHISIGSAEYLNLHETYEQLLQQVQEPNAVAEYQDFIAIFMPESK